MTSELITECPTKSYAGGVRELTAIALPMVVSFACETLMTFTDRLFLSKLGPDAMNAAMGGGLMTFMMTTFFLGLIGYTTALVAQYLGAGQKDRCALATSQGLLIALVAYPLILLAKPLGQLIFTWTSLAPEQLTLQTTYFNILIYGSLLTLLRHGLSSFFSGIGKTRIVMIAAATAMVVNVCVNYILIFGKLGLPALGIRGAAYGTIIGALCGVLVLMGTYLSVTNRSTYQVIKSLRFHLETFKILVRFGYPAGIEMFLNLVAFNGMILAFHAHSQATATAATIMFNWDMVSFVPLLGVQVGVMSLVGRYMGARNPDIAHRSAMSGLKIGWCYSAIILVLFVFFPGPLVNVFKPQQETAIYIEALPTALYMLRLAAVYVLVEAVIVVFSGALRGAGDTFWAMCVAVGLHWLMLGVLILILYGLHLSPEVAWTALVILFLLFSVVFYFRYRSGIWRNIQVVQDPTTSRALDHDQDFHESVDL